MRVHQREGVIGLHDRRERIESEREAELVERLFEVIRRHQIIEGVKIVGVGVVGIQFDRAAKLRLRFAPFPGGGQGVAARHVRFGAGVVQLDSFLGGLIRQWQGLVRRNQAPVTRGDDIASGKPGPRQRVIRIGGHRLAEQIDALEDSRLGAAVELLLRFEIEAVGVGIGGAGVAHFGLGVAGRVYLQFFGDVARDVALHLRHVSHLAFVVLAPHFRAVRGVDEVGLHGDGVAMLGDAAHQDASRR